MRDAIIIMNTRAALDGMVATRDIIVITPRIMRLTAGIIARVITRTIINHSRHVKRALRKISTITITMITTGGTFGNETSRVGKLLSQVFRMNALWPGVLAGQEAGRVVLQLV